MTYKQFNVMVWVLRLFAGGIMLQTLFLKLTGDPESVYIFSKLGLEPWGRIGVGSLELIASVLVLIPRTTSYGALLAVVIMASALFAHLAKLGVVVQKDGGQRFVLVLIVFIACSLLLLIFRKQNFLNPFI